MAYPSLNADARGGRVPGDRMTGRIPFFELRPGDELSTDPRHEAIERGRLQGCVPGDPAILAAILANPAGYYVNVHNSRFPGGALRPQLEA